MLGDGLQRLFFRNAEILVPRAGDKFGLRARAQDGVHGVARCKSQRAAPRPTEGLEQLLQNLVGTIGRPHVVRADAHAGLLADVLRQRRAQFDGVALGIAVELSGVLFDGGHDVPDQRLRRRVGVFVGVELVGHRQLRGSIGAGTAQFFAQGKILQLSHCFKPLLSGYLGYRRIVQQLLHRGRAVLPRWQRQSHSPPPPRVPRGHIR